MLVGVDDSESSLSALLYAAGVAETIGWEVVAYPLLVGLPTPVSARGLVMVTQTHARARSQRPALAELSVPRSRPAHRLSLVCRGEREPLARARRSKPSGATQPRVTRTRDCHAFLYSRTNVTSRLTL